MIRKILFTVAVLASALSTVAYAEEDPELANELLDILKQRQAIYATDPNASSKVLEQMWLDADNIVLVSEEFHQPFHGRD